MKYNHEPCCCVTSNECEAPANYDGPLERRLLKCYACGLPVCRACSRIGLTQNGRRIIRVRLCDLCHGQQNDTEHGKEFIELGD